ncbi:MAG: alpha/beta hydrolase [Verrucomicrobiales bacterium]|nr:alpha/beta hydrolase [Verrucomicrobiales bacterium]
MTLRRILSRLLLGLLALLLVLALIAGGLWWYFHPRIERTDGIVYGHRGDQELCFDVLRPAHPNGLGILVMVSGGWKSGEPGTFGAWLTSAVTRRGYTVFPVYHVSQPRASVPEIIQDMHRAVRFIRHHAKEYGVDPDRLGVTGGSAGGHLSLMLATTGGPGPADAEDPVDHESSAVQAVAIFYPVTDLIDLGKSTENLHDGGPPKSFRNSFGPGATNVAVWKVVGRECSPLRLMSTNLPPTLIYHGDADTLVPLEQSEWYRDKARELGQTVELVVHPGGKHGWLSMPFDIRKFADWFDRYLHPEEGNR